MFILSWIFFNNYLIAKYYAEEHNCAIGSVGKALKKGTKCKGFLLEI